jgi:oxygen-independent coproporphyrinogen-3 oxidase
MEHARAGAAVASEDEVSRRELPFEFMLNALRLREGVSLASFVERTGLPTSVLEHALAQAERKGLIVRDLQHVRASDRGFDFLSDLQALFLSNPD